MDSAWRIQEYLEDDGDILGDIGGITGNIDVDRTLLTDLQARLEKPHNDLIAANKYAKSKRAAKKLLAMRIRRRDADYELGLTLPALEAADQIAEAEYVLNDLT